MSRIWKFSSLSEPYIEKWLQKAVNMENNNKWSEKFKHVNKTYFDEYNVKKRKEEYANDVINDVEMVTVENAVNTSELLEEKDHAKEIYDENFCNLIDSEPLLRIDLLIEKCLEKSNLISHLAKHVSINSIDKICNYLFTNKNIDEKFISQFLIYFFPTFLKRDQSMLALDLLIKASNKYPDEFKLLLMEIIKDIGIKNSLLQEFMQNSNLDVYKIFISVLSQINMTSDIFLHHLNTINMVYKDYKKSENLQFFIKFLLIEYSEQCTQDKNYGRLLLNYLQAQKTLGLKNCTTLEKVIEQHKSPFKRPCLSIFNELK